MPAATAANVCRNMRQLFWLTMGLCLFSSVAGQLAAWEVESHFSMQLGIPGTIILISVALFVASALLGPWLRNRASSVRSLPSAADIDLTPAE